LFQKWAVFQYWALFDYRHWASITRIRLFVPGYQGGGINAL
jgi:hypothetical protein